MTDTRKAAWTPDLDVYAEMLREQDVWADGCSVMTCGATTGHSVRPLAFCDSNATAQVLAAAMKPVAIMAAAAPALAEALDSIAAKAQQMADARQDQGGLWLACAEEARRALALARGTQVSS